MTPTGGHRGRPDSGTLTVGSTVELSYVDQSRDSLDPDNTLYEEITDGQDSLRSATAR